MPQSCQTQRSEDRSGFTVHLIVTVSTDYYHSTMSHSYCCHETHSIRMLREYASIHPEVSSFASHIPSTKFQHTVIVWMDHSIGLSSCAHRVLHSAAQSWSTRCSVSELRCTVCRSFPFVVVPRPKQLRLLSGDGFYPLRGRDEGRQSEERAWQLSPRHISQTASAPAQDRNSGAQSQTSSPTPAAATPHPQERREGRVGIDEWTDRCGVSQLCSVCSYLMACTS